MPGEWAGRGPGALRPQSQDSAAQDYGEFDQRYGVLCPEPFVGQANVADRVQAGVHGIDGAPLRERLDYVAAGTPSVIRQHSTLPPARTRPRASAWRRWQFSARACRCSRAPDARCSVLRRIRSWPMEVTGRPPWMYPGTSTISCHYRVSVRQGTPPIVPVSSLALLHPHCDGLLLPRPEYSL